MHMKLMILDEWIVGTGSFNWTKNAINSNYENFVITDSPKIVEEHLSFFDKMWDKYQHQIKSDPDVHENR